MSIIRFEDFGKTDSKKVENKVVKPTQTETIEPLKKVVNAPVVAEKRTIKSIKNKKVVNENAFLVGSDFKVKVVVDVPQSMVKEYIDKVKEETDKDPLDNFSEAEIAEQIITFLIKKNLLIDNLTPEFTVGSENVGNTQKTKTTIDSDEEDLNDDLDIANDDEIEFNDFEENDGSDVEVKTNSKTDSEEDSDGEIEFDNKEEDSETDSEFDEFEFEEGDNEEDTTTSKKTIGDLKREKNQKIEKKHKEEENSTEEEEENYIDDTTDIFKNIGYRVGYHEQLANLITKNNYLI